MGPRKKEIPKTWKRGLKRASLFSEQQNTANIAVLRFFFCNFFNNRNCHRTSQP